MWLVVGTPSMPPPPPNLVFLTGFKAKFEKLNESKKNSRKMLTQTNQPQPREITQNHPSCGILWCGLDGRSVFISSEVFSEGSV